MGKSSSAPDQKNKNSVSENAKEFIGRHQGDIVRFGAYEQDNDTTNGKEDIEQIVLYAHDEYVFLMNFYGLDCQTYHDTNNDITCAECSLQTGLNGLLYHVAFSSDEKKLIETAYVTADENMEYNIGAGDNTMDNVICLKQRVIFPMKLIVFVQKTKYAVAQGVYLNNTTNRGQWQFQNPGNRTNTAACINRDGTYDSDGIAAKAQRGMVCPALQLKLF